MTRKFARGDRAWFIDQRDGLRKRYRDMVMDGQLEGLQVARDTYEPKHPQEKPILDLEDPQGLEYGTGDTDAPGVLVVLPSREDGVGPKVLYGVIGGLVMGGVQAYTEFEIPSLPAGFTFLIDDQGSQLMDDQGALLYAPV